MTLVSIIIPCYNQGRFLHEALDSVLAQTYQHWECIVVNDGSADETEAVAKQYAKKDLRIKYIYQQNGGLSMARNSGIVAAKGKFIQLLDSDDLIEPLKLEAALNLHQQEPLDDNIIVYSSMRYYEDGDPGNKQILGRDNFMAHVEIKKEDSFESQKQVLFAMSPFVVSASLYPAKAFKDVGLFDEALKALEDWDFHIRCVLNGYKFHHHCVSNGYTLIRLHNSSMMRNQKLLDDNFYRVIYKHDLRKIEHPEKEMFFKALLRDLTPPIFLKINRAFRRLRNKK